MTCRTRTLRGYMRARDKAAKKNATTSLYFGWTDTECQEAAGFYCPQLGHYPYRHQFRIFRAADGERL